MKILSAILFGIVILQACGQNTDDLQEQEYEELQKLKAGIEALAGESFCNEEFSCKYIALGSKPCGGPWGYLVYSTSIEENELATMVEEYNQKEKAYNEKWDVVSDCAMVAPPSDVVCENGQCKAVFNME